ncbi:MAG: cytochrome c3 family protein [Myxococcota bacterium]|nr:cytochrome c3 family protein [Myxococcota bacterium]
MRRRFDVPQHNRVGLKFSHQLHLNRQMTCETCHRFTSSQADDSTALPTMAICVNCHKAEGASQRCDSCHLTRPDGRLQTKFGHRVLKPTERVLSFANHGPGFKHTHGPAARLSAETCSACHQDNECASCHLGQMPSFNAHPGDYIHQHSVDAKVRGDTCESCHQPQRFCMNCHARSGVAMRSGLEVGRRPLGPSHFHPPGFVRSASGAIGPSHHGHAARRNLRTCVSCHQENDCVRCHSTTTPRSLRANPHPDGFDCRRLLSANIKGCLKCHQDRVSLERMCNGR